ncbi:caspase family protein [Bosea sp. 124]|uniref:caspase family protein n=1 Tax=Bosea sp. 124 TaxID=2135642 RepID=UPI000D359692|nr:caspase family protein [Bosea sp. 124]PTM42356.1 putative caspase-like protein [Bosea sp. 124]
MVARSSTGSVLGLLLVLLAYFCAAEATFANEPTERRVALVIGNSAYRAVPRLLNPRNDAQDVSAALRAVGFEVIEGHDLDRRGMGEALGRFARAADGADAALFFYAGHGLQFRGENFLLPVDASPADELAIPYETTRVADVVEALQNAAGVRVLILDACRNNPMANRISSSNRTRSSSVGRGLAPIPQNKGMVVAYATQANDVAADGMGRNSPFSAAFIEQLGEPGLEIGQLFRKVAVNVNQRTTGKQTPELSLSLLGDFYFNRSETDIQAWAKLRESDDAAALRGFVSRFPGSYLADAAKARVDAIDRAQRESALNQQIARYEEERRKAMAAAEAAAKTEEARLAGEKAERDRLVTAQADIRRKAEDDAVRQQAEQKRRLDERFAELEAEKRRFQSELAARAEQEARRARDDKERERQSVERDRLAAGQADRIRTAEDDASRQKLEEERRIAERLAKLEEENRRASAELAARFKAEQDIRDTSERERTRLIADIEAERRRAAEELQRVQREAGAALAREKQPPSQDAAPQIASLARDAETPAPAAGPGIAGLTSTIHLELRRVGCYNGKPDAEWSSRQTKQAVQQFARLTRTSIPDAPNDAFLDALKRQPGRICPLSCPRGQIERDGACVVQKAQVKRAEQPQKVRAQTPKATPPARSGRCFSFNGQSFCE